MLNVLPELPHIWTQRKYIIMYLPSYLHSSVIMSASKFYAIKQHGKRDYKQ